MQFAVRTRLRTIVVAIGVIALVIGVVAAPADATNKGHDDYVDWARDYAIGVVDHKIDLLQKHREHAKTGTAREIYSEAIEELGDIRNQILEEDDVDAIWELKYRAKDRYSEAKKLGKAADEAGEDHGDDQAEDDSDDEKKDDHEAAKKKQQEEERKRKEAEAAKKKQQEEERKRKEAEAAEKKQHEEERKRKEAEEQAEQERAEAEEQRRSDRLAHQRVQTLNLIDKKVRRLTAASRSTDISKLSNIYREAAGAIEALRPGAQQAETIEELDAIRDRVWHIYHTATRQAARCRADHDRVDDDTSDEPGDDTTDEPIDEAAILDALNSMELEVDMYQIEIQLNLVPEVGIGFPEGPAALDAGSALLDAIDAARRLTGDELVGAYNDILIQYDDYVELVRIFDQVHGVGIF